MRVVSQVEHDIEGYKPCRGGCGTLVVEAVYHQTGGYCHQMCWPQRSRLAKLEVVNEGAAIPIPKAKSRRKKTAGSRRTPNSISAQHAAAAAAKRLKYLFPEVYAMLLDEERVKRGLVPKVRLAEIDYQKVDTETMAWAAVYDALIPAGDNDGTLSSEP